MSSQDNHKGRKLDSEDFQIARVKGMPDWAEAMQKTIMQHTTDQIASLRKEVDEAKVMAMNVQEEIRGGEQGDGGDAVEDEEHRGVAGGAQV